MGRGAEVGRGKWGGRGMHTEQSHFSIIAALERHFPVSILLFDPAVFLSFLGELSIAFSAQALALLTTTCFS